MAPGLFSRFIKGSSPLPSWALSDASGSSRESSSTLPSQKTPSRPITPTIKIGACVGASRTSLETQDTGSSQVVTVVVEPPSPHESSRSETWEDSSQGRTTFPVFSGSDLACNNTNMPRTLDPRSKRSASSRSLRTTPETTRDSRQGENGTIIVTPIVESPTALKTEFFPQQASASSTPARDLDAVSISSTSPVAKKRPWKKSTTHKPTALATAITASGVTMAQPTLSLAQQPPYSSTAQKTPMTSTSSRKPGSPPYSSRSPPGSSYHVKGKSADFSPASGPKRLSLPRSGAPRTSTSIASDNVSEYYPEDRPEYYSALDASSDEDDSEENESILDDMEDMPVTGFAVASNKRNADFHELFPSIPEGDYLIEGRHTLPSTPRPLTLVRLRLRTPTRYPSTRSTLYLGKSHMLPCKHFRLDHGCASTSLSCEVLCLLT